MCLHYIFILYRSRTFYISILDSLVCTYFSYGLILFSLLKVELKASSFTGPSLSFQIRGG